MLPAIDAIEPPKRALSADAIGRLHPRYVVWEITLACNLRCGHCGSRAGAPRRDELTTAEGLALIGELARAGTREITLIGGEAYLRPDWLELVAAIDRAGIQCTLQTGGRGLTEARIAAAAAAGLAGIGVSIDGTADTHDSLRGVEGSHEHALAALRAARRLGLMATANTQINRRNLDELETIFATVQKAGAMGWQLQLTVPMGNAADSPDLLLQPYELASLMPRLYALFEAGTASGVRLLAGNNIGFFGPYEAAWRSITGRAEHYGGCMAGRGGLGIEADGALKGCPSLPSTAYVGGTLRDRPFTDLWQADGPVAFMRDRQSVDARLWGFCAGCYYGPVCGGGCTWTSHVLSGRPGNNPYCHYRVMRLAERGLREIVVHRQAPAEPAPFDHGLFEILVEDGTGERHGQELFDSAPDAPSRAPDASRDLVACGCCDEFHYADAETCPRCGTAVGDGGGDSAAMLRARAALARSGALLSETSRLLEILDARQPD